jgi:uncharacterized protein YutE (UPF0331/DUF86 family)
MADVNEKIAAEIENIEKVLLELNQIEDLSKATTLELAGIGALLHNYYNCIENIIKQILKFQNKEIPAGSFWHRDLLDAACSMNILSLSTKEKLGQYLAFRHYFVHGYALDLHADQIAPLVTSSIEVFNRFKEDLLREGWVC